MASTTGPVSSPLDSQKTPIYTVTIFFGVLTIFVMFFRLVGRLSVVGSFGIDDVLMCVTAVFSLIFNSLFIHTVKFGMGSHIQVVRAEHNYGKWFKLGYVLTHLYNICTTLAKVSILTFYTRLGDRTLRLMSIVMICLVTFKGVAYAMVFIFECKPIPAAWDIELRESNDNTKCINIDGFFLAGAVNNLVLDVITYCLPYGMVRRLQVPRRQKIAIGTMLGLGLAACIAAIIRIVNIAEVFKSDDRTYINGKRWLWSVVEVHVTIFATALPSLKLLIQRYLPKILNDSPQCGGRPGDHQRSGGSSHLQPRKNANGGFSILSSNITPSTDDGAGFEMDDYHYGLAKAGKSKATTSEPDRDDHSSQTTILTLQQQLLGITRTTEVTSVSEPQAKENSLSSHGGFVTCTVSKGDDQPRVLRIPKIHSQS